MSERDTQFQGFAKLLWSDILAKIATIEMSPDEWIDGCPMCTKSEEVTALIEPLIAERAYDLVQFAITFSTDKELEEGMHMTPEILLDMVPDMTEWPKSE